MAEKSKNSKQVSGMPVKTVKYSYPSVYGSHKSMVVTEHENGTVTCKDEHGEYMTTKDRLDTGLADPQRYSTTRTQKLYQEEEMKQ